MPALSNPKHEAIIRAYIADPQRIGSRAYKAVFPKASGRAAQTAWSRLLRKAEFQARLAEIEGEIAAAAISAAVMELHEVLAELSKIGRANMQDYAELLICDDVVAGMEQLSREKAAAIQECIVETYVEGRGESAREIRRFKFKLHSKQAALSQLREHHEPKRIEHSGEVKVRLGERLDAALKRIAATAAG